MKRFPHVALLLCLLVAAQSQGASAPATPHREDSLDEVVVHGTKLDEIMQEMVQAEDRFFARYNELNTNDDFDMHCAQEARVGTAIRRRACRAVYMNKAFEVEGQNHAEAMKEMTQEPPRPWRPPLPATITIEARRKDYQQNMRDVVRRNPELIKMLRERYELGKRYEAKRRKVWGLKPPPEEEAPPAAPVTP